MRFKFALFGSLLLATPFILRFIYFEKCQDRKKWKLRKYLPYKAVSHIVENEAVVTNVTTSKQHLKRRVNNSRCVNIPAPCKAFIPPWPDATVRKLPLEARLCDNNETGISYQRYLDRATVRLSAGQKKSRAPLIFINMPKAVQRRKYIIETFKHSFEHIVRVPGVNANSGLVKELKLIVPGVKEKILAVLLSHFEAIKVARKEILRNNSPQYALIIEDDAEQSFRPFWKSNGVDELVSHLPSRWQVIQLGMTRFVVRPSPVPYYNIEKLQVKLDQYAIRRSAWGAFAYMISKEGIEAVLQTNLEDLSKKCRAMTADDCLLGFKPGGRPWSPFNEDHQYMVTPQMFGVHQKHAHTGHRKGRGKQWHSDAANAGQCTALYENVISFNS